MVMMIKGIPPTRFLDREKWGSTALSTPRHATQEPSCIKASRQGHGSSARSQGGRGSVAYPSGADSPCWASGFQVKIPESPEDDGDRGPISKTKLDHSLTPPVPPIANVPPRSARVLQASLPCLADHRPVNGLQSTSTSEHDGAQSPVLTRSGGPWGYSRVRCWWAVSMQSRLRSSRQSNVGHSSLEANPNDHPNLSLVKGIWWGLMSLRWVSMSWCFALPVRRVRASVGLAMPGSVMVHHWPALGRCWEVWLQTTDPVSSRTEQQEAKGRTSRTEEAGGSIWTFISTSERLKQQQGADWTLVVLLITRRLFTPRGLLLSPCSESVTGAGNPPRVVESTQFLGVYHIDEPSRSLIPQVVLLWTHRDGQ